MKCSICGASMVKSNVLYKEFNVDGRFVTITHLSGHHCKCCNEDVIESYDLDLVNRVSHVLNDNVQNGYLTVNEVMQFTNWSRAKIYTQIRAGKLSGAYKFDNRWRIPKDAIIALGFTLSNSEEETTNKTV